jgi:hypothetical protein
MTTDSRNDDFLRPPQVVAGMKLRPLSSGSFALLHRTKNAFVYPQGGDNDHFSAALEYAFIHAAPLDDVLSATHSCRDAFLSKVFNFAAQIPLNTVHFIIHEIEESLNAAARQSVDLLPRPGGEDKDAPPNS